MEAAFRMQGYPLLRYLFQGHERAALQMSVNKEIISMPDGSFHASNPVKERSAPLRLRELFLESGGFEKGACGEKEAKPPLRRGGLRRGGASAAPSIPRKGLRPLTLFPPPSGYQVQHIHILSYIREGIWHFTHNNTLCHCHLRGGFHHLRPRGDHQLHLRRQCQ